MAFSFDSRIRYSEVDSSCRLSLTGLTNYFQDCSVFHSQSHDVGIRFLADNHIAWVLSSWQICINRLPLLNEQVKISTWAYGMKAFYGYRNFTLEDAGGSTLAYANSVWAYMDMKKGRPVRPSAEEVDPYGSGEPLEMDYQPRKIKLPESAVKKEPFAVRKYHIDTNEHVNNCQYVQMAMEYIEHTGDIRQVRVEYKNSAVYGDIIVPKVAAEETRTVVELCDESDRIFATVEFS